MLESMLLETSVSGLYLGVNANEELGTDSFVAFFFEVSLKMITAVPGIEDLTAHINTFLPDQVRMWGFVRVNSGFNARLFAPSSLSLSHVFSSSSDPQTLHLSQIVPATPESTNTSSPRTSSSLPNLDLPSPRCSKARPSLLPRLHPRRTSSLTTLPSTLSGRRTEPRELGRRMR